MKLQTFEQHLDVEEALCVCLSSLIYKKNKYTNFVNLKN
jgi:hypothetical protein